MTVEDILKRKGTDVFTTDPSRSVQSAAELLHEKNIAALLVVEEGSILGIVTERDITRAFARFGEDLVRMRVRDIMTEKVTTVKLDDSIKHVAEMMTRHRTRHYPVLDAAGKLCGMVSIGDVVKHRLQDLELEANVLRDAYFATR